jgi:hypothetical protein
MRLLHLLIQLLQLILLPRLIQLHQLTLLHQLLLLIQLHRLSLSLLNQLGQLNLVLPRVQQPLFLLYRP